MKLEVRSLGERLLQLRTDKGLSLTSVAESADVAKSYLAKLERGEVPNPGLKTLDSIAKALDVTLAQLVAPEPRTTAITRNHERGREYLFETMPRSLREFVHDVEKQDGLLPVEDVRALVALQFRGKRPETVDDWRFVYEALKRSTR